MTETVKLTWRHRCQHCGELRGSTRLRTYRSKGYRGPCEDSFCYASCEMDVCHETAATICAECEGKLTKK